MTSLMIAVGEKVILITKRAFQDDARRHFIGTVVASADPLIRVEGYAWIANSVGQFERRPEFRVRVFSLSYGGEIVLVVPPEVDTNNVRYTVAGRRLVITDDAGFSLDITEFGPGG